MSMNEIRKNENGKIYLAIPYYWDHISANMLAESMTAADMERLLDACSGDFSKQEAETARAISIKATLLLEKREEQAKRQAEYRKQRAKQIHECIVDEIRTLCGDAPCFTPTVIQLLAAQNGLPVRTRQMYSSHLRSACYEGIVSPVNESFREIHVIYADGKSGTQCIRQKGGYKFK